MFSVFWVLHVLQLAFVGPRQKNTVARRNIASREGFSGKITKHLDHQVTPEVHLWGCQQYLPVTAVSHAASVDHERCYLLHPVRHLLAIPYGWNKDFHIPHVQQYCQNHIKSILMVKKILTQSYPYIFTLYIANLRYPAKNDKFFAGERRYSHWYQRIFQTCLVQARVGRWSTCQSGWSHLIPKKTHLYPQCGAPVR